MKIFSRAYTHFYDELSKAFMQLVDNYSTDESHILNIGYIIKVYDFGIIDVNEISYQQIKENDIERIVVELSFNDGTRHNIYELSVHTLITIYETIVYYLLCIEYGITFSHKMNNLRRDKIIEETLKIMENDFNNNLSVDVKLFNNKGIMENTSTIEYIAQVLSLTQKGKVIEKDKDDFDDDDEYIAEQMKVNITLTKNNNDYMFNVKHELFDIDLKVKDMSPYELLSIYDTIIKNKKAHY